MRSLFLIGRHGESFLNDSKKYRGWSDGPDAQLNENGIESAHEAARYLLKLNQPLHRIICSPLGRSLETAAIIAEYFGITQLQVEDRLRPLNVGELAGQSKDDNPIGPYLKNKNKKFPDGESVNDFEQRQYEFSLELLDLVAKAGENILVEAHVSNTMYWWNATNNQHREEYLDESDDLILPGGLAMVTEHATVALFKENPKTEPPVVENKLDQSAALYFDAKTLHSPRGARCDACYKFIKTGGCVEVTGQIEAAKVCGLYMPGTPFKSDPLLPVLKISQETAGYGDGNTQCKSCEYFGGYDKCRKVRSFDGDKNLMHIEEKGCCDLWDEK